MSISSHTKIKQLFSSFRKQIHWETQFSFKTEDSDRFTSDIQMSLIQPKMGVIWPSYFFLFLSDACMMTR